MFEFYSTTLPPVYATFITKKKGGKIKNPPARTDGLSTQLEHTTGWTANRLKFMRTCRAVCNI
jgi:hypothetical protein